MHRLRTTSLYLVTLASSSSWSGNQTQPIRSSVHSFKPMLLTKLSLRLREIGENKETLVNVAEEGSGTAQVIRLLGLEHGSNPSYKPWCMFPYPPSPTSSPVLLCIILYTHDIEILTILQTCTHFTLSRESACLANACPLPFSAIPPVCCLCRSPPSHLPLCVNSLACVNFYCSRCP